jgi:hypothetical protein
MGDTDIAFKRSEGIRGGLGGLVHGGLEMNTMSFDKGGANPKMTANATVSPGRLRARFTSRNASAA